MKPRVIRLTAVLRNEIASWLDTDIDVTTGDLAEATAEETAEVIVEEEVVAEFAIDLAAAVPALAGLAVVMAIPLLISALAKQFVLHLEVNNVTDVYFTWSMPYTEENSVTVQPASSVLPKMAQATDSWGGRNCGPCGVPGNDVRR